MSAGPLHRYNPRAGSGRFGSRSPHKEIVMRKSWMSVLGRSSVVAGVLLAGSAAMAEDKPMAGPKPEAPATQPGGQGFRKGKGEGMRELLDGLNLSEEQRTQIHQIHQEMRGKRQDWEARHGAEAKALRGEMKAAREAGDKAKVQEVGAKMKTLMADAPKPKEA